MSGHQVYYYMNLCMVELLLEEDRWNKSWNKYQKMKFK